MAQMNLSVGQKQNRRHREQGWRAQGGEGWGRDGPGRPGSVDVSCYIQNG